MAKAKKTPETFPLHTDPAAAAKTDDKISKTEAIRRALAAGIDKPLEVVKYVQDHFGLTVKAGVVSTTKFLLNKKAGTTVSTGRRSTKATPAPASNTASVELVRNLKSLITAYGPEAVKEMAQVLSE